ncbi:MAG: tetratricopeptide repeat protein [Phycisphaerae bacterium]
MRRSRKTRAHAGYGAGSLDPADARELPALKARHAAPSIAVIVLAVFVAFQPALRNGFVAWDDDENLVGNPHIRTLSVENLRWMARSSHIGVWQPLAWFVTAVEYRAFGADDPTAFRRGLQWVSLGLHAVAAVLCFFLVVRLMTSALRGDARLRSTSLAIGATVGALFFAIHPLRVEVVAWASGQPYLLATVAALAATLVYLKAWRSRRRRWYAAAFLFLAAALLCKSIAVPLPIVWLLLDFYPLRRFDAPLGRRLHAARDVLVEKIPYLAIAGVVAVLAYRANPSISVSQVDPFGVRSLIVSYALMLYAGLTFVPVGIAPYYARPHPIETIQSDPWFLCAGLAVLVISVVAVLFRRRRPCFSVLWFAHVFLVLPTAGLVLHGGQLAANRYTLLPAVAWSTLVGALSAIGWGAARGGRRRRRIRFALAAAAVVVMVGLGARARTGCRVWHDSVSLWRAMVRRNPGWPNGPYQLGKLYRARGDVVAAERSYRRALEIYPGYPEANVNLGILLQARGELDAASRHYRRALEERPRFHMAHYNLACLLIRQARYAEALEHLKQAEADAIQTDPGKLPIIRARLREVRPLVGRRSGLSRE